MTTYEPTHRFAARLLDVDDPNWPTFLAMASIVLEEHGEDSESLAVGLLAAKQRGDDLTTLPARWVLWSLGIEADYYVRLKRAIGDGGKQPAVGPDAGGDR